MKSESFIVDLEGFSTNGLSKETTINSSTKSRITLQRNLSRKGPQRGAERNINDRDTLSPSSSPKAAQVIGMPEKSLSPLTPSDNHHSGNTQLPQHQIIIKTGVVSPLAEGKWGKRSSTFKRSPPALFSDPKRILLFFATLSSMGTILLIYFTLTMSKRTAKEFHF